MITKEIFWKALFETIVLVVLALLAGLAEPHLVQWMRSFAGA